MAHKGDIQQAKQLLWRMREVGRCKSRAVADVEFEEKPFRYARVRPTEDDMGLVNLRWKSRAHDNASWLYVASLLAVIQREYEGVNASAGFGLLGREWLEWTRSSRKVLEQVSSFAQRTHAACCYDWW